MDQQVHIVTIATAHLDTTRAFYGALGWVPHTDVEDEIIFYQVAQGFLLGFFEAAKFRQDLATGTDHASTTGMVLAHNVESPEAVGTLVDAMARPGGTVRKAPQPGEFGGIFHAHVEDPNGVTWEIAHNPGWHIAADGEVSFG